MKKKNAIHSRVLAALLCLTLCGVLSVGAAQARYSAQIKAETLYFQTEQSALTVAVSQWTALEDGSHQAAITITNHTGESIRYSLTCLSSLGSGQAAMVLEGLTGKAQQIVEGSMLSKTFGSGWSYSFRYADGTEGVWQVDGGKSHTKLLTVTPAAGTDPDSSTIFQIQVERKN